MKNKILLSVVVACLFSFLILDVRAVAIWYEISGDSEVEVGDTLQLKAEFWQTNDMAVPGDDTPLDDEVTKEDYTATSSWSSSNPAVATVNSNGVVTGVGEGTVTISATISSFSRTAEHTVTVVSAREDEVETELEDGEDQATDGDDSSYENSDDNTSTKTTLVKVPDTGARAKLLFITIGGISIVVGILVTFLTVHVFKKKNNNL